MSQQTTLHIAQEALEGVKHAIKLTLERPNQPRLTAKAEIEFALTPAEREELRWYMEDYLYVAETVEAVQIDQIEQWMKRRGEELYNKVLDDNQNTRAIWFTVREQLADLRVEITTGIAEAASIPWELMRDPQSDSTIALRVQSFVRVQSDPNLSFVPVPSVDDGRIRLLYIVCRPGGRNDVELRAVANRLLQDLGEDLARFDITALRPPTFEQLQKELANAKEAKRPYHIVHFDGHGVYADLSKTKLADWLKAINALTLGSKKNGKHGYLLFEHPGSDHNMRPVSGDELGKLLHDTGVPVLVLNACQSAMHEAVADEKPVAGTVHDEVRAIGSLAQAVIDQGIPAVLGMRYSVFVVTAAQYIGQIYAALARGRPFGQAASEGRKHLAQNPDRWVGLQPRPLQDWFVPVIYEAMPIHLLQQAAPASEGERPELDPVQNDLSLLRHVPDTGFVGRDETLLMLDRAFDAHRVVLLHAYAGQGKTATTIEFARWYAKTGGLGPRPVVLFTSFENPTDLNDVLNQIGQQAVEGWSAINEIARKRTVVLKFLRRVPVLWIWDNVEPIAGFPEGIESQWTGDEQRDLADFLKLLKEDNATKARILLTSRRDEQAWLGGIPHRIAMPRLRNSDAAKLAFKLSEEKNLTRTEIADWQPLLDYCFGNPLTLRVLVGQAVRTGLRGREQIGNFVEAIRSGEHAIEDADEKEGRDKSLGASLNYGFRHAFKDDELAIIALLHLFRGTVSVFALGLMGEAVQQVLPELKGKSKEHLTSLLERAKNIGLLTQIGRAYFTIHPVLPWFLSQLFSRNYDSQVGRSTSQVALHAWVEAVGAVGNYYWHQFSEGNRSIIRLLEPEEANLLHARRLARRHQWWDPVISCMQGLKKLYVYQGRMAEWTRLVEEIVPDYCTADYEPILGREGDYSLVMGYRVDLAQDNDRDPTKAAALLKKVVGWDRQRAAVSLALPVDAPLDDKQHNRLRTLAVSLEKLGNILREEGQTECQQRYHEAISICRRIKDTTEEAVIEFNLGHAHMQVRAIRDLTASEAAFQRSLDLFPSKDALNRSQCLQIIGTVHHEWFREARKRNEPVEALCRHIRAAEEHYVEGVRLCPIDAFTVLAPMHNCLGILYAELCQLDIAREHFEKATQYFENTGNHFDAGSARFNMANMYLQAIGREATSSRQRDILHRAHAYAQAALRDFQHYQGRAVEEEAEAQRLLAAITQALTKLPP